MHVAPPCAELCKSGLQLAQAHRHLHSRNHAKRCGTGKTSLMQQHNVCRSTSCQMVALTVLAHGSVCLSGRCHTVQVEPTWRRVGTMRASSSSVHQKARCLLTHSQDAVAKGFLSLCLFLLVLFIEDDVAIALMMMLQLELQATGCRLSTSASCYHVENPAATAPLLSMRACL